MDQRSPNPFLRAAWAILAAGLAIPLVIFILTGFQSRFIADDYCTGAVLNRYGWWGMQVQSYQTITLYAGNRFTLTLLISLGDLFGPLSVTVYPAVILLLWVSGNVFLLRSLQPDGRKLDWLPVVALSEFFVWFAITAAPNRFQDFYWRQAMLPYLAPFPLAAWLAGLVIRQRRVKNPQPIAWAGIGLLGFLTAGLSETAVAVLLPAALLGLLAVIVWRWVSHDRSGYLLPAAAAAFVGILIGFILVVTAPMNLERMSFYTDRLSLPNMIQMIWQEGWLGFRMFLWQYPSSFLALIILSAAVGFTHVRALGSDDQLNWKLHILELLLIPLLTLILCLAASAPAVYAQGSGPEPRARFVTLGVVLIGWTLFGFKAGWLVAKRLRRRETSWFVPVLAGGIIFSLATIFVLNPIHAGEMNLRDFRAALNPLHLLVVIGLALAGTMVVLLINRSERRHFTAAAILAIWAAAVAVAPVLQSPHLLSEYETYRQRAAAWDARDAAIRTAAANGVQSLTIPALDSVAGVVELREETYWVNNCAEWYYGIPVIEAQEMNSTGITP